VSLFVERVHTTDKDGTLGPLSSGDGGVAQGHSLRSIEKDRAAVKGDLPLDSPPRFRAGRGGTTPAALYRIVFA
jgi:hypothetical protein